MAITIGTSTVTSGNRTTGFTLAIDAGVQTNDILVLAVTNRDATADPTVVDNDTTGNLWTRLVSQNASGNGAISIWWKRATSGTASKTITVSGCTGSASGVVTPFRGASADADPFTGTTPVGEANASGNETQAQINVGTAGSMVFLVVGNTSNDTLNAASQAATDPSSLTEQGEGISTGGSDCSVSLACAVKSTSGNTGAFTWTQTDGTTASVAFALRPAVVAAVSAVVIAATAAVLVATLTRSAGVPAQKAAGTAGVVTTTAKISLTLGAQKATATETLQLPITTDVGAGAVVEGEVAGATGAVLTPQGEVTAGIGPPIAGATGAVPIPGVGVQGTVGGQVAAASGAVPIPSRTVAAGRSAPVVAAVGAAGGGGVAVTISAQPARARTGLPSHLDVGLQAYWAFDTPGSPGKDALGQHNLTATGSVVLNEGGIRDRYTNSDDGYLSKTTTAFRQPGDFSIVFWAKRYDVGLPDPPQAYFDSGDIYIEAVGLTDKYLVQVNDDTYTVTALIYRSASLDVWDFVAVRYSAASHTVKIQKNGDSPAESVPLPGVLRQTSTELKVLTSYSREKLDELRVYNLYLTDEDVVDLYAVGAGRHYPYATHQVEGKVTLPAARAQGVAALAGVPAVGVTVATTPSTATAAAAVGIPTPKVAVQLSPGKAAATGAVPAPSLTLAQNIPGSVARTLAGGPAVLLTSQDLTGLTVEFQNVSPTGFGQSFLGDGRRLAKVAFRGAGGATRGTLTAKLYAHTGTFGSGGIPTGAALAQSVAHPSSYIAAAEWYEFVFESGVVLTNGTPYFVTLEAGGATFTNVFLYCNGTNPHPGNLASYNSGTWNPSSNDLTFRLYVEGVPAVGATTGVAAPVIQATATIQISAGTATAGIAAQAATGTGMVLAPTATSGLQVLPSPAQASAAVLSPTPALSQNPAAARAQAIAGIPIPALQVASGVGGGTALANGALLVPGVTVSSGGTVEAAVAVATAGIVTVDAKISSILGSGVVTAAGAIPDAQVQGTGGVSAQRAQATAGLLAPSGAVTAGLGGVTAAAAAGLPSPALGGTQVGATTAQATGAVLVPGVAAPVTGVAAVPAAATAGVVTTAASVKLTLGTVRATALGAVLAASTDVTAYPGDVAGVTAVANGTLPMVGASLAPTVTPDVPAVGTGALPVPSVVAAGGGSVAGAVAAAVGVLPVPGISGLAGVSAPTVTVQAAVPTSSLSVRPAPIPALNGQAQGAVLVPGVLGKMGAGVGAQRVLAAAALPAPSVRVAVSLAPSRAIATGAVGSPTYTQKGGVAATRAVATAAVAASGPAVPGAVAGARAVATAAVKVPTPQAIIFVTPTRAVATAAVKVPAVRGGAGGVAAPATAAIPVPSVSVAARVMVWPSPAIAGATATVLPLLEVWTPQVLGEVATATAAVLEPDLYVSAGTEQTFLFAG